MSVTNQDTHQNGINEKVLDYKVRNLTVDKVEPNKHVSNAQGKLEELLTEITGVPFHDYMEISEFVSLMFPNVTSDSLILTVSLYLTFAFLLDDFFDKQTENFDEHIAEWKAIITNRTSKEPGLLNKMFNVLSDMLNKEFTEKFRQYHDEWFIKYLGVTASTQQIKNDIDVVCYEKYDKIRRVDIGYDVLGIFLYSALKFNPDDNAFINDDPGWKLFNEWSARHLYLVNDIYSNKRETLQQQAKFTLVYITMNTEECDAQVASDKIVSMIDEAWTMVIKYGDMLQVNNVSLLDEYVSEIKCVLKGNLYWSSKSSRYQNLDK